MSSPSAKQANISLNNAMLHRLKFRPLLIFKHVLEASSIVQAARELNLTQPAVTKAIQELEADLGVSLFERTNRGVIPTCYGTLLGTRVKSVIAEIRYLTDELNAFHSKESGHIIIGTLISASARLLPRTIAKLKQSRPGILVTVREGPNDRLFPMLANGELDIILGRLPESDLPQARMFFFERVPLYHEEICAVVGSHHPLARQPDLHLSEILKWPWILPAPESPARATAENLFLHAGLDIPANTVESLSLLTNIGLLQDSPSISLMPLTVAHHFAHFGIVSILDLGDLGSFGTIGYSIRADKDLTPATGLFIEYLKKTATEH